MKDYVVKKKLLSKLSKIIWVSQEAKKISFRQATKEELEEIRRKVIKQRKQDFVKTMIAITISILLTALLVFIFIWGLKLIIN